MGLIFIVNSNDSGQTAEIRYRNYAHYTCSYCCQTVAIISGSTVVR